MEKLFDLPESTFKWVVIAFYLMIIIAVWYGVSEHDKKIDEKRKKK